MSPQQRANIQTAVPVRELSAQSRLRSMRCTKHVDYRSVLSHDTLVPHLADIVDDVTSWRVYFPAEPDHANNIYRTISCDIAERDAAFKDTLCDMIMEQEHLGNTSDVSTQFTELILASSRKMSTSTPTLVITDALNNHCNEMPQVLEMLANKSMELPNNPRVLVTTRPETDIVHAFQHKEHVLTKTIGP
ncbi:hypothetical protein BDN67DRAFT_964826 [Paxillus ammoniavirescens]|nr:hypothetical protein BDN67DRAFT_964826 [Paxillus ammoniavirescens]